MGLLKAFCKHLCPSETCPYKQELLGQSKKEPTPPYLPPPKKGGINESHDKTELGWSFDDIVKRAFLMLDKRYENMLTENNQSISIKIEYNLDKDDDESGWSSRKELQIYRYYDSGMSACEIFKSNDDEEDLEKRWKELVHKLNYFDNTYREEY